MHSLEKPCMAHLPFLMDRANEPAGEPCGHALMASCPPVPFQDMNESRPWGHSHTDVKAEPSPSEGAAPSQGTWELSKADLATLLDLSGQLDLDGEITPVMAWGMIMNHPQFADLSAADFRRLAEELGSKVRCYGYVVLTNTVGIFTNRETDLEPLWRTLNLEMPLRAFDQPQLRWCIEASGVVL